MPTIVGELKRHFRDRTWAVRPPRELQELILRVDRLSVRLSQELDRAPTVAELAEAAGADEEHILEALQARSGRGALSLHAPSSHEQEAATLEDSLGSDDDGFDARRVAGAARRALRRVVGARPRGAGMRFEEDLTQAEIGERLGVSQMQVSRIIRHTLARLHHVAEHQDRLMAAR